MISANKELVETEKISLPRVPLTHASLVLHRNEEIVEL